MKSKEHCYPFDLPNNPQERSKLIIYCGECADVWEGIAKLQNSPIYPVGLVQRGQSIHWFGADLGSYKKGKKNAELPFLRTGKNIWTKQKLQKSELIEEWDKEELDWNGDTVHISLF